MADVIKSYLISLSGSVDKASFDKFASALAGSEKMVASSVGAMAGSMLKFQVAGTTAFASVGFGIVAYIDKLGRADLMMKQHAMQNMMSVQQYRAMTMALDTMGVSLEDVFNGTAQMKSYFAELINDQVKINAMLGPDYEQKMQDIQDVHHQIDRLKLKGEYFGMKFASDLLEKLGFGQGGILLQLEQLNDFVLANMPRWSKEIVDNLVPALEQTYDILKKTGGMFLDLSVDFDNFIGTLSGDDSINKKSADFESFARSVSHVVFWAGEAIKMMIGLEKVGIHSIGSVFDLLKAGWKFEINGDTSGAWKALNDAADQAVGAVHGFAQIGAAVLPGSFYGDKFESPSGGALQSEMRVNTPPSIYQNMDFQRLVMGVAQIESGGKQTDASGKTIINPKSGAIGMMQLMPSTAKMLGVDPYNAAQNFVGGEKYLAQLLLKHGGNVHDTLAEYGGFRTQSPDDYVRKVEQAGGITIGTIVIQSAPSMTPEQHTRAIKTGVSDALKMHMSHQILATNGAYGGG